MIVCMYFSISAPFPPPIYISEVKSEEVNSQPVQAHSISELLRELWY